MQQCPKRLEPPASSSRRNACRTEGGPDQGTGAEPSDGFAPRPRTYACSLRWQRRIMPEAEPFHANTSATHFVRMEGVTHDTSKSMQRTKSGLTRLLAQPFPLTRWGKWESSTSKWAHQLRHHGGSNQAASADSASYNGIWKQDTPQPARESSGTRVVQTRLPPQTRPATIVNGDGTPSVLNKFY